MMLMVEPHMDSKANIYKSVCINDVPLRSNELGVTAAVSQNSV